MAYFPNPLDITQPTGSVDSSTAAAEFRALKTYLANLQGSTVTWNPSDKSSLLDLSAGNLIASPNSTLSSTSFASTRATIAKSAGSWYYEVTCSGVPGIAVGIGTASANLNTAAGTELFSVAVLSGTGDIISNGTILGTLASPIAAGGIVGIGFNLTTGDFIIKSAFGTVTVNVPGFIGATAYPLLSTTYLTNEILANFGATAFTYTPPVGYLGLYVPVYIYSENANLLINSGCVIDQQNAGSAVNPVVNNTYTVDGWLYFGDAAAKFKAGHNLNAVAKPPGYSSYLGVECIAAYVPAAAEAFWLEQRIEGYNTAILAYATANASPVTLLTYVYSSIAGTHSGALTDGGNTRAFPFEFSIPAANTWTAIAVLIPGDVAGTWNNLTTATNMKLRFNLGAVTARQLTAGAAWQADINNCVGAAGGVDIVNTLGATFYVTGLELRRGLYTANQPRELKAISVTWSECLRYFYKTEASSNVAGVAAAPGNTALTSQAFPVRMRVAPTVSATFAGAVNCTGAVNNVGPTGCLLITTSIAAGGTLISYSVGNTFDARL